MPVPTASSLGVEKFDLAASQRRHTIACAEFAHHVVDVVFYCLFRDFQLGGDLFIRKTVAQQHHQLRFPAAEPEFNAPG